MLLDKEPVFKTIETLIRGQTHVCVGVSGGSDSLALAFLLDEWARKSDIQVTALSVDHGLRPEAGDECRFVARVLDEKTTLKHVVLTHTHPAPESDIQAWARAVRYDLMGQWCLSHGVKSLFLGHHLDDQGETFLLRLARGSGVDGLSAMQMHTERKGLLLLRPLLETPKAALQSYLEAQGQSWIEDPSNEDAGYDRVRVRAILPELATIGLTAQKLAHSAQAMARARHCLERLTRQWLKAHVIPYDQGYLSFERQKLQDLDEEILFRVLSRIAQSVGGKPYPGRLSRLGTLSQRIIAGEDATFMGCRWIHDERQVVVCPEVRHCLKPESVSELWEGRSVIVDWDHLSDLKVRALGEEGWAQVIHHAPALKATELPFPVRVSLVSFWREGLVVSVPQLAFFRDLDPEIETILGKVRSNLEERLFS